MRRNEVFLRQIENLKKEFSFVYSLSKNLLSHEKTPSLILLQFLCENIEHSFKNEFYGNDQIPLDSLINWKKAITAEANLSITENEKKKLNAFGEEMKKVKFSSSQNKMNYFSKMTIAFRRFLLLRKRNKINKKLDKIKNKINEKHEKIYKFLFFIGLKRNILTIEAGEYSLFLRTLILNDHAHSYRKFLKNYSKKIKDLNFKESENYQKLVNFIFILRESLSTSLYAEKVECKRERNDKDFINERSKILKIKIEKQDKNAFQNTANSDDKAKSLTDKIIYLLGNIKTNAECENDKRYDFLQRKILTSSTAKHVFLP